MTCGLDRGFIGLQGSKLRGGKPYSWDLGLGFVGLQALWLPGLLRLLISGFRLFVRPGIPRVSGSWLSYSCSPGGLALLHHLGHGKSGSSATHPCKVTLQPKDPYILSTAPLGSSVI